MVRLPFAAASGKDSVLHTLVESDVPVQTFGCETIKVRGGRLRIEKGALCIVHYALQVHCGVM